MTREREPFSSRDRSFSSEALGGAMTVLPPPFSCPPVVFPSGSREFPPPSPPSSPSPPLPLSSLPLQPELSDVEKALLRGLTLSLAMEEGQQLNPLSSSSPGLFGDWDCWLAHDNFDGFILCVWNYASGELREICMKFVTDISLSRSEKGEEVITLACEILTDSGLAVPSTLRFFLKASTTPQTDEADMAELFAILDKARQWVAKKTAAHLSPKSTASKKRVSVHSTLSVKRPSIMVHDRGANSVDVSGGEATRMPSADSLVDKLDNANIKKAEKSPALDRAAMLSRNNSTSVRNIFGNIIEGEEGEEDEEDDES